MNEKISLQDLVALLAEKANITKKDAETLIKECFDTMGEGLVKDKLLKIKNLGTFKLVRVEDRESVDVSTGERVIIPAHYKVAFSPDIELAEKVNAPYTSLENIEVEENELSEKTQEEVKDENEEDKNEEENEIEEKITEVENKQEEIIRIPEKNENTQNEIESKEEGFGEKEEEPTKAKNGLLWLFFGIAFLLILFFAGRYFYSIINSGGWRGNSDSTMVISNTVNKPAILDSMEITKPDSAVLQAVDTLKTQTVEAQLPKAFTNKTYKVLEGERLTVISLREYGHKAFWVYIYEENKNRINNPDLINPGMVINIPPPEKYGIDKNNPESVNKALGLEQKYKQ